MSRFDEEEAIMDVSRSINSCLNSDSTRSESLIEPNTRIAISSEDYTASRVQYP